MDQEQLEELLAKMDTEELMQWLEGLGVTDYIEGYVSQLVQQQIQNQAQQRYRMGAQ